MQLDFKKCSILVRLLQSNYLSRCLIQHHGRNLGVCLYEHGQLLEAVLARIHRLQRMVQPITMLEQLHFLPLTFGG